MKPKFLRQKTIESKVKESKGKESKVNTTTSKDVAPIDYELANLLIDEIANNLPTFKKPNIDSWAKENQ